MEIWMMRYDFHGKNARIAKRRALNYWYLNRTGLGLSMTQFFRQCRMSEENGTTRITFYPAAAA